MGVLLCKGIAFLIIAEENGKNKPFPGHEKTARSGRFFTKEEGDIVIQYRSQTHTDAGNNLHRFVLTIGYHKAAEM